MKLFQKAIYYTRANALKEAVRLYHMVQSNISDEMVESFKHLSEWLSVNASSDDSELIGEHISLGHIASHATLEYGGIDSERATKRYKQVITGFKSIAIAFPQHKEECIEHIHTAINRNGPDSAKVHGDAKRLAVDTLLDLGVGVDDLVDDYMEPWTGDYEASLTPVEVFHTIVLKSKDPQASFQALAQNMENATSMLAYLTILKGNPELYTPDLQPKTEMLVKNMLSPPNGWVDRWWESPSGTNYSYPLEECMLEALFEAAKSNKDILRLSLSLIKEAQSREKCPQKLQTLEFLYCDSIILNNDQNKDYTIAKILTKYQDLPVSITNRQYRIEGKTLAEQEEQDTLLLKAFSFAEGRVLLDKNASKKAGYFIDLSIALAKETPNSSTKQKVIEQLNKISWKLEQAFDMIAEIAQTSNDSQIIEFAQSSIFDADIRTKIQPIDIKRLVNISHSSPQHAHIIANTLGECMRVSFEKTQNSENKAAADNWEVAQEALIEVQSPTSVHILQKWIRAGYSIGADKSTFNHMAADNLSNAYVQLIENGKLSGQTLESAYLVLAKIADEHEHSQYRQGVFQLAQERLYKRVPDPYRINYGALSAIHILGLHHDYALKSFNVLADLVGLDIEDHINVIHALTAVTHNTTFLGEQATQVFENYLADHQDLPADEIEPLFNNLAHIAMGNEDLALDIIDLLGKEGARNSEVAQEALIAIAEKHPLYKNKAAEFSFEPGI